MQALVRSSRVLAALCPLLTLVACATGSSRPDIVQPLSAGAIATPHLSDVSIDAKPGLSVSQGARDRIVDLVKTEIAAQSPDALATAGAAGSPPAMKLQIVLTEYDEGNAFARAMLAGLGQIKISADVDYLDAATGTRLGEYRVSKDFAFGGIYGATTKIEDVEKGFAKSVAETLKANK